MKKETSTEDIVVEKPFDRSEEKFWLKASVYFLIETLFMVLTASLVWAKSFYGNINIENILFSQIICLTKQKSNVKISLTLYIFIAHTMLL